MTTWHSTTEPESQPDRPHVSIVVPCGRLDGHAQPEVRAKAELIDRLLEVGLKLGLAGMGAGPVVWLERVAVQVGAHVDLGARVRVVPPGAADPGEDS